MLVTIPSANVDVNGEPYQANLVVHMPNKYDKVLIEIMSKGGTTRIEVSAQHLKGACDLLLGMVQS